ncbi:MAG: ATP-binding protein, partial [Promethearchaeota archaeon]
KQLFTPEEAKLALKLRYAPIAAESLESIYQRLKASGIAREPLEQLLDTMARKGLILSRTEGDTKYYSMPQWMIGIYEFQVNKLTPQLFFDIVQFSLEAFGNEAFSTKIAQLRTIPIEQSIIPEHQVASYDHIKQLIDAAEGPFVVANCICRQGQDLLGNPCKATHRRETCLGFGTFAQMYIDQGWGREISKRELVEIIEQNEEDGLILQPSNSEVLEYVCSCCGCCCALLLGTKTFREPASLHAFNYYAVVDAEACTGCGACVEKCQMQAISLQEEKSQIDLTHCIGCGVCTAICSASAISLVQKEEQQIPPKTLEELYETILKRKTEIRQE